MKSLTIHGIDDILDSRIKQIAQSEGLSLNKTIKKLLKKALGINRDKKKDRREDFLDTFNVWSEKDLIEFNNAASNFSKVDPEDWQ